VYPVFVYGTLHPEHKSYNEWLVEGDLGIHEWYKCTTKGTRLPSMYPWDLVWFGDTEDEIEGACLVLDNEAQLRVLDRYENFSPDRPQSSMFVRKQIEVVSPQGIVVQAWGYEWNRPKDEEIERIRRYKEHGLSYA
jgi:gamma-glutamylcyclotransferase (GGCT)/AIG2-like uncharacterized protein YtfP